MKISQYIIIFGGLILFGSLLILLSVSTSPVAPLLASLSIIIIMQGIFEMRKYSNMIFFTAFSTIILLVGAILAYYNASMPINGEHRAFDYTYIGAFILLEFFIIYGFIRRLKKLNKP